MLHFLSSKDIQFITSSLYFKLVTMTRSFLTKSSEKCAFVSLSFMQCNNTLPVIYPATQGGLSSMNRAKKVSRNMGFGLANTFFCPPLVRTFNSISYATCLAYKIEYNEKHNYREPRHLNFSSYVDRTREQFTIKETDKDCVEALNSGLFLLYHKGNALMSKEDRFNPIWIKKEMAEEYLDKSFIDTQSAFLKVSDVDRKNHHPLFALPTPRNMEEERIGLIEKELHGTFTNLRLSMLSGKGQGSILSHGYSLLRWLHNTKFCSKCGSPAKKNISGSRVTCSNDKCGVIFYPPTSPVGIVLVASSNHSNVLLVRQPQYPVGMYSCVAGFVDIGETIYDCVKREVAEEAGVEILPNDTSNFKVLTSQHWPFPNGSLMTGCLALAAGPAEPGSDVPTIDDHGEIEHARWFEVQEVIEALRRINKNPMLRLTGAEGSFKASDIFVPPPGAIAHQLLKMWLKEYHDFVE